MNINALKERLSQLNRSTNKSANLWKPKDEHDVRMVQNPHSSEPFQELYFHNEIGDAMPILCPRMNSGKDCPICDFADKLKAWKDPETGQDKPKSTREADFEIFKKIQAKARVFVPVIERGKEDEGAKWWSMTPAQAQQALEMCLEGDRLEEMGVDKDDGEGAAKILFGTAKGYDIHVSYAKPGEKQNSKLFTQITLKGRIKPSALSKDEGQVKKILESIKKLSEVFPTPPASEVERAFQKFVNAGGQEAKAEGGTEKYAGKPAADTAKKPTNSNENAKVSGTRSLDQAFGDMLKDEE